MWNTATSSGFLWQPFWCCLGVIYPNLMLPLNAIEETEKENSNFKCGARFRHVSAYISSESGPRLDGSRFPPSFRLLFGPKWFCRGALQALSLLTTCPTGVDQLNGLRCSFGVLFSTTRWQVYVLSHLYDICCLKAVLFSKLSYYLACAHERKPAIAIRHLSPHALYLTRVHASLKKALSSMRHVLL